MQSTEVGFSLSPQQRRVLFLDAGLVTFPFIAQLNLMIEGTLDLHKLEAALALTAAKHEILRTQFVSHPELKTRLQVILPEPQVSIECRSAVVLEQVSDTDLAFPPELLSLVSGHVLHCRFLRISPEKGILSLTIAAACSDATSLKKIASDLVMFYAAGASLSQRNEDVLQYADVAEHFNSLLRSEIGPIGAQFWQARIAAGPPDVCSRLRRQHWSTEFSPRVVHARLSTSVLKQAESSLASHNGVFSEEVFLIACWRALLQRVSGNSEFGIGYAANGRTTPELKDCVGLFEKYLPLQLSVDSSLSFRELNNAIRDARDEMLGWQDSYQGPGESEFLPVCFSYYDGNWNFIAGRTNFICSSLNVCTDRYELKLSCTRLNSFLIVDLWYDPAAYQENEVARLLSHFIALTENASAFPEKTILQLCEVGERERQHLIREAGEGARGSVGKSVVSRIEQHAKNRPDAVALEEQGTRLSYAELNKRANQLGHYLRELGVGPEVRVGVYLERSIELIIGLVGILKAGGVYVPLDPSYPPERLAYILEDAQAKMLLTHTHLQKSLPAHGINMICLDSEWHKIAASKKTNLKNACSDLNLAYAIYTSGSTGRPKGVAVTLAGLHNHVNWACTAFGCHENGRSPLYTSIGFDLCVTSLWPMLAAGGCVVLIPESAGLEAVASADFHSDPYTLVKATPTHLRIFQEVLPPDAVAMEGRFVLGGEALSWEELAYWRKYANRIKIVNEYGPTETVVASCAYDASGAWETEGRVPIGKPIANTRFYVLDEEGQLTPAGVPGELYIGGVGVARGYLNQAALTAERFVPDGFGSDSGERLFRTGDLVRWKADGQLEYLERIDRQVKIRGYRIEIGEVEAVLRVHPSVRDCVVITWQETPGDKKLIGYVIPIEGQDEPDWEQLKNYLRTKLPEYMVPSAFVVLNQLPLLLNGKVDHKALPKPQWERRKREFVGPRTAREEDVARIWKEVLNLEMVSVEENFFEIGGHSLLAMQVIARIRSSFQIELPLRAIFDFPTVALLAQHIEDQESELKDILSEAESLSDEEIEVLLSREANAEGK